jgi:anti-anti-sigma regulatory factor
MFHVHGTPTGVAIVGEVDSFSGTAFSSVLAGVGAATAGAVLLDFSGLEFADVNAMCRLADFARTMANQDRSVLVRDALPIVQRVWTVIGPTLESRIQFL